MDLRYVVVSETQNPVKQSVRNEPTAMTAVNDSLCRICTVVAYLSAISIYLWAPATDSASTSPFRLG